MRRGFIRGLWGIYNPDNNITKRRFRIDKDIQSIKNNSFSEEFKVYVMGENNCENLQELGFNCVLVNPNPAPFDLIKHQYRHKLEIIKFAMEEDNYDEIVYLDWDCIPQKKTPDDFWEKLNKKDIFQANLQVYHRRKAYWRKEELRKVPNGGFLYLRDKTLPSRAIEWWEKIGKGDNDEPAWARLTDEMMGGWKGIDEYWERFEPMFCDLHKNSPYPKERLAEKKICFKHYQGGR